MLQRAAGTNKVFFSFRDHEVSSHQRDLRVCFSFLARSVSVDQWGLSSLQPVWHLLCLIQSASHQDLNQAWLPHHPRRSPRYNDPEMQTGEVAGVKTVYLQLLYTIIWKVRVWLEGVVSSVWIQQLNGTLQWGEYGDLRKGKKSHKLITKL